MKWPWRREDWRGRAIKAEAQAALLQAVLGSTQQDLRTANGAILQMKLEGFVAPPVVQRTEAFEAPLPPLVRDQLLDIAEPGTRLWHDEAELAFEELTAGASAEEVAESVRKGGRLKL